MTVHQRLHGTAGAIAGAAVVMLLAAACASVGDGAAPAGSGGGGSVGPSSRAPTRSVPTRTAAASSSSIMIPPPRPVTGVAGSSGGASRMPTSPPPEMPGVGSSAQIGLSSNGKTVVLTVGRRLVVTLAEGWTAPRARAAGTSVTAQLSPLNVTSSTGFPAAGPASAAFMAVRTGLATVTARTDYACLHTSPGCAPPQRSFTVTVRVLPPTGSGGGALPRPPSS
jgi:hypothetical protein